VEIRNVSPDQRLLLAFVLLCTVQPAYSQSAPVPASKHPAATPDLPTATIQVSTRLVVLDVVVTDKKGNPVTDLTQDDFTVVEDKQLQRIRSFESPSQHALPPGEIVDSTAQIARIGNAPVNILVLDELNTPFEDNAFSRYSLQKFLKAQPVIMPPTELLVTNDRSFAVLQDFTQNLPALEAALKRDPAEYPWRLARNGNSGPEAIVRLAQTLNSLEEIAQASAGTPGRKNIIWVGKGFPSVDMTGLDDTAARQLQDAIKRCTDLLLSSRVTLFIVDPTPLSSVSYDTETPTDLATLEAETATEPFSNAVRFSTLAPVTGGRVFSNRNDVDHEIATSMHDGALYYTLSYTPSNASDERGEYRSVRIALNRPGLIVSTRDGYYAAASAAPASPDVKKAGGEEVTDVANAALSKMVYNGLKVRAGRFSPGRYTLAVADSSLSWQPTPGESTQAAVSVVAVCFSSSGKVLSHITEEKGFMRKAATPVQTEEIFTLPVDLPPMTARLRFVLRDTSSGHLGTVDLDHP
jgi:VWFA-related protein